MRTIEDHTEIIRDWTDAYGCSAWRSLLRFSADSKRIATYDETHPAHLSGFGNTIGGEENAKAARRAERRYRLAAWVLKRIDEGRDAYDAMKKEEAERADWARIMKKGEAHGS